MTPRGQVERTFRGSATNARKELAALTAKSDEMKKQRDDPSRTFGELLEAWLTRARSPQGRAWAPKTLHENRRESNRRIRPRLGKIKLEKLGATDLDAAYDAWSAEGLSDSSVHRSSAIISAALRQGVKWGWLDRNPAEKSTPPAQNSSPKIVTPSPEQVARLIRTAHALDPVMETAVWLAFATGARRGELCALRWSDIDTEHGFVKIERSLTQIGDQLVEKETKNRQTRIMSIGPKAQARMHRHMRWQIELARQANSALVEDPYVLSDNANGARPLMPEDVTDRFTVLRGKAEVRRVRFHDLRHANITQQEAAGIPITAISARAGHNSTKTTFDRYAHGTSAGDTKAAEVIDALLPD
jgi:integrase